MANEIPTENVCGLYDSESNVVYLDTGKVIRFRGKLLQTLPNKDEVFDSLNRWARYRGHTKEGEVIGVY
ncbi:TPA: hypothetical protein ACGSTL_001322 [Vibrio parahaemolyticus]|uniref:hypothetical protein n=1 Tax=Vibrio campbellii TaxID=680 RepID=UPI001F086119|nr:hypothetical protein [Vibrio campbellii]UMM06767.1 hypothetical protein MKR81_26265 [Vibrio campbellii]